MSRRSNAVRALANARRSELAAWEALLATPTRTRDDVASAPVAGDTFTGGNGLVWVVTPGENGDTAHVWAGLVGTDDIDGYLIVVAYMPHEWRGAIHRALSVHAVESPARIARRLVWERAAARLETARRTLEALPPVGHKRRKDGTTYPVQGPRENAARKAGRDAWRRAMGRSLAFMGVALAFVVLFLSACN